MALVGHGPCREGAVAIQAGTIPSEAGTVSNSPVPRAEQHMRASYRQVLLSVVSLGPGAKENSKRNQKDSGAGTVGHTGVGARYPALSQLQACFMLHRGLALLPTAQPVEMYSFCRAQLDAASLQQPTPTQLTQDRLSLLHLSPNRLTLPKL